jgi:hypothetical protein
MGWASHCKIHISKVIMFVYTCVFKSPNTRGDYTRIKMLIFKEVVTLLDEENQLHQLPEKFLPLPTGQLMKNATSSNCGMSYSI